VVKTDVLSRYAKCAVALNFLKLTKKEKESNEESTNWKNIYL
jgi:hypothetical protein